MGPDFSFVPQTETPLSLFFSARLLPTLTWRVRNGWVGLRFCNLPSWNCSSLKLLFTARRWQDIESDTKIYSVIDLPSFSACLCSGHSNIKKKWGHDVERVVTEA